MPYASIRLVTLLGLALSVSTVEACKREAPPPQIHAADDAAPIHVATAGAQARQVPVSLALTGTLVPDQQSEVTPLVSGRVDQVRVERGTIVRAGDPMLILRDVDFRQAAASSAAAVEQARSQLGLAGGSGRFDPSNTADVRTAQSQRDSAEDTLRRSQQLAQTGAISDQDLQRAIQGANTAREQYASAINRSRAQYFQLQASQVALSQSQRSVNDSIVRAPFDGEVAERHANVGEYVSPQRAVVTLVRTDPMRLELQVPQDQIANVHEGQSVAVSVDAFPNEPFPGTVRYISAAVQSNSRALVAEAIVPNPHRRLLPGIFATARLDLGRTQNAVSIPPSAVVTEAGTSRAYVVTGGRIEERVVTVLERRPTEVLVGDGIHAGEQVATERLDRLSDGARVQ